VDKFDKLRNSTRTYNAICANAEAENNHIQNKVKFWRSEVAVFDQFLVLQIDYDVIKLQKNQL